jgi:hypothetical protein
LHHLEAPAFTQDNVLCWNSDVLEDEMGVSMRRVVISIHRQHALHLDAGRICRYDDDRLLLVLVRMIWIRLAQHDVDFAPWISSTADPPFLQYLESARSHSSMWCTYLSI